MPECSYLDAKKDFNNHRKTTKLRIKVQVKPIESKSKSQKVINSKQRPSKFNQNIKVKKLKV